MDNSGKSDVFRQIPAVQQILESDEAAVLLESFSRAHVVDAIRASLNRFREEALERESVQFSSRALFDAVRNRLNDRFGGGLRRVINATGISIHTNLGRAPLADEALDAIRETAARYSNLEFDLDSGARGTRYDHVEHLLCELTGAESAIVVNNNAAAVILALDTFAKGQDVIVSRGELIEIGGSFRMPDVIARSGARLVEVGATNKTRIADYRAALSDATRVLMKVHPSNYRMVGFTESATRRDLVGLARETETIAMEDLGSGTLIDLGAYGLPAETTVQESVAAGLDLVSFSGDKLLGGPQAGIVVGRTAFMSAMKQNPLIRALRMDKLSLAALEATLRLYLNPEKAVRRIPLYRQLLEAASALDGRAAALADRLNALNGIEAHAASGFGYAGGGALPDASIPTRVVRVQSKAEGPDGMSRRLRRNDPPVVGRVADDALILDMRTVTDGEAEEIARAFASMGP